MKKYIIRLIAVLIFASAVSSCTVEYRERHHHWDHDHYRDHDDHDHEYHDYH
ncbi:MAG TPA: hypothetical protein VHB54_09950 [Mucilaginibacter sp.]|nr:hypothetical protein [Bacteroidota bacterium]HVS92613.1 hypothetical protein [Mucilaginibacter sp.]HVW14137.1 hypothetical protein [Mucilaginibacter sp.]